MSLVAAKCPYCGNTIDADSGRLFGVCQHCDQTYNTQNAIAIVNLSLENSEQLKSDRETLKKAVEENDYSKIKSSCRSIIHVIACDFLANYYHAYASKERNNPFYYVDFLKNMDNEIGSKEEQEEVLSHLISHANILDCGLIEEYVDRTVENQGEYISWIRKIKNRQNEIKRDNGFKIIRRECYICYSQLDEDVALEVASVLESVNIKCFVNARNLDKDKEHQANIEEAIASCRMVILIASNRALQSYTIKDEMIYAMNRGLKFIEFKIDESQSDISFKHTIPAENKIETFKRRGEYYSVLINMVKKELTPNTEMKTRFMDAINTEKDELEKVRLAEPVVEKISKKIVTMDENLNNVISLVDENELDRANALVDELLENYPNDYRCYLAKVRIQTLNFKNIDDQSHKSYLKQAYSVSSPEQVAIIDELYTDFLAYRFKEMINLVEVEVSKYDESMEKINELVEEFDFFNTQTKSKVEKTDLELLFQKKSDLEDLNIKRREEQKYTDFTKRTFFEVKGDVLVKYTGRNAMIQIPEGIKVIGEGCFQGLKSIKVLTIPYGIEEIGDSAFSECSNLESITLPETLTTIGDDAFSACSLLREIVLPEGVTKIGYRTFYNCSELGIIKMSDNVTEIGGLAFSNCKSLYSINIPSKLVKIGKGCFSYCSSLQNMVLPEGVDKIEGETFYHCTRLDNITLSSKAYSVGEEAFSGCTKLLKVVFPSGLKHIHRRSFLDCKNLKNILIPKHVERIGNEAFLNCTGIKELKFEDGCTLDFIGKSAFSGCENIKELILPEKLEILEENTFYNLKKCESIVLSPNLLRIEKLALYGMEMLSVLSIPASVDYIGEKALYGCDKLNTVYFTNKDMAKEFNKAKKTEFYKFAIVIDK